MADREIWAWLRVPLRAFGEAIGALKERSMQRHEDDRRAGADQDDEHAENLKAALRDQDDPPTPLRWPRDHNGDK